MKGIIAAPGVKVNVIPVKNNFFGGGVTVTGLVCGKDLIETVNAAEKTDVVLISSAMLRGNDEVFLDDVTLSEAEEKTGTKIIPTDNDGFTFVENILGEELEF